METDLANYFKKSNTPQFHEFAKVCENYNGKITDEGACEIRKDSAKALIRDWRDNSIEKPDHNLKGIFARNDLFFLCYANKLHTTVYFNLNNMPTDEIFNQVHEKWISLVDELKDDDYYNSKDWRIDIANYGYGFYVRKKKCNEEEEIRLQNLGNDVWLGKRSIEDVMMGELTRKKVK